MPRLLILNPNTGDAVTAMLCERARRRAPAGLDVSGITAAFGARYIAGEVAAAVAGHAALAAYAETVERDGAEPDAVLLACFGDPGLFALQALAGVPVLGLAEASMREAVARHGRIAVLTGGAAWVPMLGRLVAALGLGGAVARIAAVPATGGELAADPARAHRVLREACLELLDARGEDAGGAAPAAVLLGGAGLAGMAEPLAADLGVAVLDSVDLALDRGFEAAAAGRAAAPRRDRASEPGPWTALAEPLRRRLDPR